MVPCEELAIQAVEIGTNAAIVDTERRVLSANTAAAETLARQRISSSKTATLQARITTLRAHSEYCWRRARETAMRLASPGCGTRGAALEMLAVASDSTRSGRSFVLMLNLNLRTRSPPRLLDAERVLGAGSCASARQRFKNMKPEIVFNRTC